MPGIPPPGYRLPAATRLGRVRLQVADLARSLLFYEDVLGLAALDRSDDVAMLGPHADGRVLVELHARAGTRPAGRRAHLGLYHYAILLPERAALGRFLRHLTQRGVRAGMSDHAVSEALYLSDPDGLGIEVYADRARSTWRYQGPELVIVTEPLDADDLLAAGGEDPWTGAPPGTVVGHVHLHVGDLEPGAAFYHAGLGLDKTTWSYPGALFFSAGGYHHHLGINTWAAGAGVPEPDDARLLEWELVLPSVGDGEAVAESLDRAGHSVERQDTDVVTRDPWGTALRLRSV